MRAIAFLAALLVSGAAFAQTTYTEVCNDRIGPRKYESYCNWSVMIPRPNEVILFKQPGTASVPFQHKPGCNATNTYCEP